MGGPCRKSRRTGFRSEEELASLPGARKINAPDAVPGPSPEIYAFDRGAVQPNLYGIPIPDALAALWSR